MTARQKPPNPLLRLGGHLKTGPRAIALRWADVLHRRVLGSPIFELSEISPNLLLGGQHYYQRGYQRMLEYGITAVVNMRRQHSDIDKGIAGERHLQLATVDNTPPSVDDLMRGVAFISAEIERGGKVYVHCAVGCGRAPTMTAAYLVSTGLEPDAALQRIRQVRPFINPTRKQKQVLSDFAAYWAERGAAAPCLG
ncbi:MAG: dual specificity protein phosphatase family protein [Anaerolineae bacterium]|nr:dual specificity protein phosphatase family protein [Anaerolineae bacterium]